MLGWWRRKVADFRAKASAELAEPLALMRDAPRARARYLAAKGGTDDRLSDWLTVATWQLSDDAKQRVREEVEAHVWETVDALIGEGRDFNDAFQAALDQLGDPHRAQRMYRRERLTVWEERQLSKFQKDFDARFEPRNPWSLTLFGHEFRSNRKIKAVWAAFCVSIALIALVAYFPDGPINESLGAYVSYVSGTCLFVICLLFIGRDAICRTAMRRLPAAKIYVVYNAAFIVAFAFGAAAFGTSAFGVYAFGQEPWTWAPFEIVFAGYFVVALPIVVFNEYRTWRKVRSKLQELS